MARLLRERWGAQNHADVVAAISDGPDAFRDRVRDRLLAECADEIFINRCSRCSRVVATPRAQQCLWCGHTWHVPSPE